MKEITKTITVFEADDGTCFENAENCTRYEDQLKCVKFFRVLYDPNLTETGRYQGHSDFVVYSKYGHNESILEQYLRNAYDWNLIGPSVMGYGIQLHYRITNINRSEIDKTITVLSPIELDWYPKNKNYYFNYMKEWGLK